MTFKSCLTTSMVLLLSLSVGCTGDSKDGFGISTGDGTSPDIEDTNTDTDTPDDTDTDNPDDTDTDNPDDTDTNMDTGAMEPSGEPQTFDEPGDVVVVEADDGVATVDLSDSSGESNTEQDFYLIVVNTSEEEEDVGFALEYHLSDGEGNPPVPERPVVPEALNTSNAPLGSLGKVRRGLNSSTGPIAPPSIYTSANIGTARQDFKVRDSITDEGSYERIGAVLWALGSSVSIWVDESVAVDWDQNCDGTIDIPAATDAYGFDNCDLEEIASIVDYNTVPNLRAYFGDESDENGDGMVLFSSVVAEGQKFTLEPGEVYFLATRDAGALDYVINDKVSEPVGRRGQILTKRRLDRDAIIALQQ